MKRLLNKTAKIKQSNDNENYDAFRDLELIITHVAYNKDQHPGYDSSMEGEALCDFEVKATGASVPFSLYEYEFDII